MKPVILLPSDGLISSKQGVVMLDTAENTPEVKTDNVPPDVGTDEKALSESQKASADGELPPTDSDHKPDDDSEQAF
ncbi:MAG: hypothetical protein ACL7AX_08940 [Candidatus Arsenophonus phytopathogenicus]